MKKILVVISIFFALVSFSANVKINPKPIQYLKSRNKNIYKAYLVADSNGHILYKDNIEKALPLASLTKLVTAMVVLDNVKNLNTVITVNKKYTKIPFGARLRAGEKYTVKQLLYIMLVKSTNSAAQILADYVSKNNFTYLMNKKARQIGAKTAHFYTPNGLPPKYTKKGMDVASARDMYKLSRYAINYYPLIRQIVSTKDVKIKHLLLYNTNNLLYISKNIKGIKTGYHDKAKFNISVLYNIKGKKYYEIILGSDSLLDRERLSRIVLKDLGGR